MLNMKYRINKKVLVEDHKLLTFYQIEELHSGEWFEYNKIKKDETLEKVLKIDTFGLVSPNYISFVCKVYRHPSFYKLSDARKCLKIYENRKTNNNKSSI